MCLTLHELPHDILNDQSILEQPITQLSQLLPDLHVLFHHL
jgi:hypothetical protein